MTENPNLAPRDLIAEMEAELKRLGGWAYGNDIKALQEQIDALQQRLDRLERWLELPQRDQP